MDSVKAVLRRDATDIRGQRGTRTSAAAAAAEARRRRSMGINE